MKANKQNKTNVIPSLWVEWATMPWLGEAPLLDGGAMDQWRMEEMECGWLERERVSMHPWEA